MKFDVFRPGEGDFWNANCPCHSRRSPLISGLLLILLTLITVHSPFQVKT